MIKILIIFAFIGLISLSLAEENPTKEKAAVVAVSWFDNFTYGGWTTLTGIAEGAFGISYNKIKDPHKHKGFRLDLDPTNQQIIVYPAGLVEGHSSGAFNLANGKESENQSVHEASHGKQASILGPFFLPVVLTSYFINSFVNGDTHNKNPIESWANAWKYLGNSMVDSHPLSLRLETQSQGGRSTMRVGTNFVLLEKSSKLPTNPFNDNFTNHSGLAEDLGNPEDPVSVTYRYGEVGVHATISDDCEPDGTPIKLEGTLFSKNFMAEWSTISSALRLLIDSKQETGKLVVDLDYHRVDATFLSHALGIGVQVGNKDKLALDLIGRGSGAIKGTWPGKGYGVTNDGIRASVGVGAEVRLHLFDRAEVYARKEKEWGTGGYARNIDAIGTETPLLFTAKTYTGFKGNKGKPTPLFGGVTYQNENEKMPGLDGAIKTTHIKMTIFTLGGRW